MNVKGWIVASGLALLGVGFAGPEAASAASPADALRVVVSTTDLESLVKEVGGGKVVVVGLSRGEEDPHELELRPGFTRELERADLFVQVGLGIENAWLERLMRGVRNDAVKPGRRGNLNLGAGVRALPDAVGAGVRGSYHEEGNPHYLLDPVEGLRGAREVRDRLIELRPAWRDEFIGREREFAIRLGTALVGEECAKNDDPEKLALEWEGLRGPEEVRAFLVRHRLGGWLAALAPYRGRKVVGDHDLWPYFARRNGLEVLGYLEPSPGVPPTTRHLEELVALMKGQGVRVILAAPYFDRRHVQFVARHAGATAVPMAHQTGARPGTGSYPEMLRYNYERLLAALKEAR